VHTHSLLPAQPARPKVYVYIMDLGCVLPAVGTRNACRALRQRSAQTSLLNANSAICGMTLEAAPSPPPLSSSPPLHHLSATYASLVLAFHMSAVLQPRREPCCPALQVVRTPSSS
jgi:hypothetical protein